MLDFKIEKNSDLEHTMNLFSYIPRIKILGEDREHLNSFMNLYFTNQIYFQIQYKGTILLRIFFDVAETSFKQIELCTCNTKNFSAKINYYNYGEITLDFCKKFVDDEYKFRLFLEKKRIMKKRMESLEKDFQK